MKINGKRRGIFEILIDILDGAKQPLNKNRLMMKSNLGHKPISTYIEYLENLGFIMKIPPPKITHGRRRDRTVKFHYKITIKGNKVLKQISKEPLSDLLLYRTMEEM